MQQLKPGGRLVCPVGPSNGPQRLEVVDKQADGSTRQRSVLSVSFVPLTDRHKQSPYWSPPSSSRLFSVLYSPPASNFLINSSQLLTVSGPQFETCIPVRILLDQKSTPFEMLPCVIERDYFLRSAHLKFTSGTFTQMIINSKLHRNFKIFWNL